MMSGLGLLDPEEAAQVEKRVDRVARDTLFGELLKLMRRYWKDGAGGQHGRIDLNQ